jgi:hypothetical protein
LLERSAACDFGLEARSKFPLAPREGGDC